MISLILVILLQGLVSKPALAHSSREILGQWQYDGFLYENHRYPNPNPDLELTFTFTADGKSRLYWSRKSDGSFCERIADFHVTGEHLYQKVTWVNPKNASECTRDSDMRLGQETNTVISVISPELNFLFDLNGKPFLYILKRIFPQQSGI